MASREAHDTARSLPPQNAAPALDNIRAALDGMRFGTVTIVVQDGVVVQVERTEKIRVRSR